MPSIKRISIAPYELPLKSPLMWGHGHIIKSLEHVLVRVELTDGAEGYAEANPRPTIYGETPESVEAIIRRHISPELEGQPLNSTEDIANAHKRYPLLKNNLAAKAAVDMAMWSALAQSQGKSLGEMLNVSKETVKVSYILGLGTLETLMREVEYVYKQGVRVFKVKVGANFEREKLLISSIAQDFPDAECYIDANESYNMLDAIERLAAFAEMGVPYCEEPLPVHLIEDRIRVAEESVIPLIADDSTFTIADLERELALDSFDILNIKPPRSGFTDSNTMLKMALQERKGIMMGSQASSVLGCAYTLLLAAQDGVNYPCEGTFFLKVDDDADLPIVDGHIATSYLSDAVTSGLYSSARTRFTRHRHIYWNSPYLEEALEEEAGKIGTRMAVRLSEQMRNLLATMGTGASYFSELLAEKTPETLNTASKMARTISAKSQRALQLIQYVEDSMLIEGGEYPLLFEHTRPIENVLSDAVAQFTAETDDNAHPIKMQVEGDLPEIHYAPQAITLFHLLIAHLASGTQEGNEIRIHAKLSKNPNYILVMISNPGDIFPYGISARQRDIDKFYWRAQGKLDLFIAYYIVEQYRGEIRLGTEEGSPATFYVTLPIAIGARSGLG